MFLVNKNKKNKECKMTHSDWIRAPIFSAMASFISGNYTNFLQIRMLCFIGVKMLHAALLME